MPVGVLTILLLFAIFTKNSKWAKRAIISAFIFLFITCNALIINKLMLLWEISPTSITKIQPHDVGIVLTGGLVNEEKMPYENVFLGEKADRLGQAIELYKLGKIKRILLSGGNVSLGEHPTKLEINDAAKYLIISGVRTEDILLDTLSKNTRENALNCSKILKKSFPNQKYILITSGTHLRRALACFQKTGLKTTPFGANYASHEKQHWLNIFVLSEDYFARTESLVHEWIGYFVYWILGYV